MKLIFLLKIIILKNENYIKLYASHFLKCKFSIKFKLKNENKKFFIFLKFILDKLKNICYSVFAIEKQEEIKNDKKRKIS